MKTGESRTRVLQQFSVMKDFNNFQHFIFIFIVLGLLFLHKVDYYLFHSAAEIYSCIIAGAILMISLSTYKVTNNNYFLFLGIGYMIVAVLDLFHTISYGELFNHHKIFDTDTRFWVAARGLELATFLASFAILFKQNKKFNYVIVFLVYFAIVVLLFLDIYEYNIFIPQMLIEDGGITQSKIYFEYIVSAGFLICCFLLYLAKEKMDKRLFVFLEIALICKVISELSFTMYYSIYDIYNMLGHIFKVISYYFLYMGIIVGGLQRPFEMINNSLEKELKEKENQRLYMEEIINQNDQAYNWLIHNSSNGIVIIRNNRIAYANSTALRMVGAKNLNDVVSSKVEDYLFDITINLDDLSKYCNRNTFNNLKIIKLNKEIFETKFTISKLTYRGTPAFLVLLKNIELEKEINNLKCHLLENEIELKKTNEYNRVLTEFFSNISHDLKTPINVILSAVQLLYLKEKDNNFDEFTIQLNRLLGVIKQNSFRLIRLVSNLIDISKFDSGFYKLDLKNQNIVSIVEDITLSVGDYIRSKGVKIIFDTDAEEKIIAVDADKIERIMLNLLSNAVKFTDKGDEILVNFMDNKDVVKISVKDTGIGMHEEKLKMIFDRFSQVDDSLIRNKDGSGIGLSLVKSLAEMHEGKITVLSKVGEGSEFIVELPVKLIENNEEESVASMDSESKIEKVLIEFSDIYAIE